MPSLFADQFNYASPYGLNGLPTSAPTVSLRLPDAATPKGADPTGEGAGGEASGAASAAAASEASLAAGKDASNSNGKAASNSQSLSNQGTLNKLTHMESNNAGAVNAANPVPETNTYRSDNSMFDTPVGGVPAEHTAPSPSTANRPSVNPALQIQKQTTPTVGQDWATLSHGYQSVVNGLSRVFPLPGGSGQRNVGRSSTDAGVTEPSNVWNPSENSQAYTSPSAVGSGASNAIEMGPYSPQFKASFGLDYAKNGQAASEVANQPSSDDIWSGIENVVNNPGEIFSEL